MKKKHPLKARSQVIEANFLRVFGSFKDAAKQTGISRTLIWRMIKTGQITDASAGKLYKLGIDPGELVKKLQK